MKTDLTETELGYKSLAEFEGRKVTVERIQHPRRDFESDYIEVDGQYPNYDRSFDSSRPVWIKFQKLGLKHFNGIKERKEYAFHKQGIEQNLLRGTSESFFKCLVNAINWLNSIKENK